MRILALAFTMVGVVHAQSFDVASVKRNNSGDGRALMQPGRWVNIPIRLLIQRAYRIQDFQLIGGPGWINSDRFDVVVKVDGPMTPDRMMPMLQKLLEERFKLAVHHETREMPVLALVVARSDGKLGPQLRKSELSCPNAPPAAGAQIPEGCGARMGAGQWIGGGLPAAQLAPMLSQLTQRIVIDQTGLTGAFDLQLTWTPDDLPPGPPPPGAPAIDFNGPSLFTALQEQLGLKLQTQKGPVDVVVIDKIEQPTEN